MVTGSIFSQVSCDGQVKHHYKYVCKGHKHHHGYIDQSSSNSGRSVVYSTIDIYPECSSRSNDSTHEIINRGYRKNHCTHSCNKKNKENKKKDKREKQKSIVSQTIFHLIILL